ncbi:MAG: 30S ribosomal protein S9 [Nanoarchaeota archaeon]|nr:30S ribosomal protein S9 [Nanoarchaeota archaeon]
MKIIHTSGKRKTSIARATLKPGKGIVRVNGKLLETYSPVMLRMKIMEPLLLAESVAQKVDLKVTVEGGGINGQTEAIRLAIGRALVEFDNKLENVLLKYDRQLLVADIRRKEVYKPNDSKARAKRQKSYR